MRRKKVVSIICTVVLSVSMTGCGVIDDLFSTGGGAQPIIVQQERVDESDMEKVQVDNEDYGAESTQKVDLKTIAKYYLDHQQKKQAREILEAGYQLEQDAEVYEMLQDLTVNAEEEQEIAAQLDLLIQNLDIPEYANESISMLFTDEWFQAMKPAANRGKRSYYRENGENLLTVQVGFNANNQRETLIWKIKGEELLVIRQTPDSIKTLRTGLSDGEYHGDFEIWTCVASTGDVFCEKGTFQNGICVGDYTAEVKWGRASADIMSLWMMKEDMEFQTFKGEFDENGRTLLEQPGEDSRQINESAEVQGNSIIYAYNQKKDKYLLFQGGNYGIMDKVAR